MAKRKPGGKNIQRVPIQYDPADEVVDYAKHLISKHHTHLVNSKIAYLFKNKEMKLKGREVAATAEKVSTKNKVLSGYDFIITVSYPKWRELSEELRFAIIDHELAHCWVEEDEKTGEPKIKILPHDVEEFGEIIKRHGLYTIDLVKLGNLVSSQITNIKLGDPDSVEDAEDEPVKTVKKKKKAVEEVEEDEDDDEEDLFDIEDEDEDEDE